MTHPMIAMVAVILAATTAEDQCARPAADRVQAETAVCALPIATPNTELTEDDMQQDATAQETQAHPYVGMWVTEDGRIRHELLTNGRYDEARGVRRSAYEGRYEVTGSSIFYWDDTGFTADGEFVDMNTLHHGGMIFRRED
jgi:hypothetical protein